MILKFEILSTLWVLFGIGIEGQLVVNQRSELCPNGVVYREGCRLCYCIEEDDSGQATTKCESKYSDEECAVVSLRAHCDPELLLYDYKSECEGECWCDDTGNLTTCENLPCDNALLAFLGYYDEATDLDKGWKSEKNVAVYEKSKVPDVGGKTPKSGAQHKGRVRKKRDTDSKTEDSDEVATKSDNGNNCCCCNNKGGRNIGKEDPDEPDEPAEPQVVENGTSAHNRKTKACPHGTFYRKGCHVCYCLPSPPFKPLRFCNRVQTYEYCDQYSRRVHCDGTRHALGYSRECEGSCKCKHCKDPVQRITTCRSLPCREEVLERYGVLGAHHRTTTTTTTTTTTLPPTTSKKKKKKKPCTGKSKKNATTTTMRTNG